MRAQRIQMMRRETMRTFLLVLGESGEMTALRLSRVMAIMVRTLAASWRHC